MQPPLPSPAAEAAEAAGNEALRLNRFNTRKEKPMNRNNIALFGVVAFLVIGLGLTALLLMNRGGSAPTPASSIQPP